MKPCKISAHSDKLTFRQHLSTGNKSCLIELKFFGFHETINQRDDKKVYHVSWISSFFQPIDGALRS